MLRVDIHHEPMAQALRTSTSTEVLAGLIERVTFHNTENGFCVLRVKARGQRDLITRYTLNIGDFFRGRPTRRLSLVPGVLAAEEVRFAPDSALEESGFEPSVPRCARTADSAAVV